MTNGVEEDKASQNSKIDLIDESDRGCVIVAASLIDDHLKSLLIREASFHRNRKKFTKGLFESNGPLATFSGKASICRAFGLIDDVIYNDITILRKLRNRFAHAADHVDFADASVLKEVFRMDCCTKIAAEWTAPRVQLDPDVRPLPEYEIRTRGFVKYGKSIFCLGVRMLQIAMQEHEIARRAPIVALAKSLGLGEVSGPEPA